MKSKKKHPHHARKSSSQDILKKNKFSLLSLLIFALVFAGIGSYQVWKSFAEEDSSGSSFTQQIENELRRKADFNHDGRIDGSDASFLLKSYSEQQSGADIDGNGVVNLIDLNLFMDVYQK